MNEHKIAFIACVNDESEFEEALYYIDRLYIPEGYETDVIAVREAPSMAAGYNAAMSSSDAKYKIYIHQDVCLIYRNLLADMLETFQSDDEIGMLGVLGCRMMPENAIAISRWDSGRVYCNGNPTYFFGYEKKDKTPLEVMALDGMFMATQYDLAWREDVFDGWDFYDISQCFEFQKNGKKVVIPFQKQVWSYHNSSYSRLNRYERYREKLIDEYGDRYPVSKGDCTIFADEAEYERLRIQARRNMESLIEQGRINEVCGWMDKSENQGEPAFHEIEIICKIHLSEIQANVKELFYRPGMQYEELLLKFKKLRHIIKRMEFDSAGEEEEEELVQNYSVYAVAIVVMIYAYKRSWLYAKILAVYEKKDIKKYNIYKCMEKAFETDGSLHTFLRCLKDTPEESCEKHKLVILKKLDEETVIFAKDNWDKNNTVILLETYSRNALEQMQEAKVLCGTVVKLVMDMQDKLYTDYSEVIIYGRDMEEYVKVFYNTDVPVIWNRGTGDGCVSKYSKNIKIC